jgi:hypothetical protein
MEPHSRPCSSHNGTLRLPQALVLLLKSALAGPTSNPVTQTVRGPARWQSIKNSAYRLLSLLNPFVASDGWIFALFVGMVKLTVICGCGSALWLWARRNRKAKGASSTDPQPADAVGKEAPDDLHSSVSSRGPAGMVAERFGTVCQPCS